MKVALDFNACTFKLGFERFDILDFKTEKPSLPVDTVGTRIIRHCWMQAEPHASKFKGRPIRAHHVRLQAKQVSVESHRALHVGNITPRRCGSLDHERGLPEYL